MWGRFMSLLACVVGVTTAPTGQGNATLVVEDTAFDRGDATLLRAVEAAGSVAAAAADLGRSRPWALRRIETLEAAFGDLVERRRGGSDGGGSRLTDTGRALLARYDRLEAAVAATAHVPETVLEGRVCAVDGELATVETSVGEIHALQEAAAVDDAVQLRVGADAITLQRADREAGTETSARNQLTGRLADIEAGETVLTAAVRVGETTFRVLVTTESADRLGLDPGQRLTLSWKATATRLVPAAE